MKHSCDKVEPMKNYFIRTDTHDPWRNLAAEWYLSTLISRGDVILYLWQNERTVVIGRNQNALRECRGELLEAEGGYLARRTTGGGAVYHDLGNLCFTFLASPERYDQPKQFSVVMDACRKLGVNTHLSGRNDIITDDGLKFSGNAFSHTSACDIHHGTIMVDVNVEDMKRYLTPSAEKLKAKGVKSVRSRVCNLKDLAGDVTVDVLAKALEESYHKIYGDCTVWDPSILGNEKAQAVYEKYASWDWRYGKSPDCETVCRTRFDWGEVEVHCTLHGLRFRDVKVYSDALDVDLPSKIEAYLKDRRYDLADAVPGRESGKASPVPGGSPGTGSNIRQCEQEQLRQVGEWLRVELADRS